MATEKKIKGVIIPRHDTAKNWAKAVNFTPNDGELIIYSKDSAEDLSRGYYLNDGGARLDSISIGGKNYPVVPSDVVRFKFGNGTDNVNVLPFVTTDVDLSDYATEDWVENYVSEHGGGTIDEEYLVGKKTTEGGEIFNDYVNNKALNQLAHAEGNKATAGSKAFTIEDVNKDNKQYKLDSVDGLDIGDIYSAHILYTDNTSEQVEDYGKITAIIGNWVTVDNFKCEKEFLLYPVYMWMEDGYDTEKNTFRIKRKPNVGTRNIGFMTHAEGYQTMAVSKAAHAEGRGTIAFGSWSHAEGNRTVAHYSAHSEGVNTQALGESSHAEGKNNISSGSASHSEGEGNTASGDYSHAEGYNTKAIGQHSHVEGLDSQAEGYASHAEGRYTFSKGNYSHSEGMNTEALGDYSHAEGYENTTSGKHSHVEGSYNDVIGGDSHAEGHNQYVNGWASHAEGGENNVVGNHSHAEGYSNTISTSSAHAEGYNNDLSGEYSHAEGSYNTINASAENAHVEGSNNIASGNSAHVEGRYNRTDGAASHAEGEGTYAEGWASHAEGHNTIAHNAYSHAEGIYNKIFKSTALNLYNGTANTTNGVTINSVGQVEFDLSVGETDSHYRMFALNDNFAGQTLSSLHLIFKLNTPIEFYIFALTDLNKISEAGGKTQLHWEKISTVPSDNIFKFVKDNINIPEDKPYLAFKFRHVDTTNSNEKITMTYAAINDKETIDTDVIHSVGNGSGDKDRRNAFTIFKDGHAEVQMQGATSNSVVLKSTLESAINNKIKVYNSEEDIPDNLPEGTIILICEI